MDFDLMNKTEKPSGNNDGLEVYEYRAWQASQSFEIALEVRDFSYGIKDFVLTVEALDSQGVPTDSVNGNWSLSGKLKSQFCYVPPTTAAGFVTAPFLSFDAPVPGLRITIRSWRHKTSSPATLFGDVVVRTYYSRDPLDPSDQKIGSHLGIAVRGEL